MQFFSPVPIFGSHSRNLNFRTWGSISSGLCLPLETHQRRKSFLCENSSVSKLLAPQSRELQLCCPMASFAPTTSANYHIAEIIQVIKILIPTNWSSEEHSLKTTVYYQCSHASHFSLQLYRHVSSPKNYGSIIVPQEMPYLAVSFQGICCCACHRPAVRLEVWNSGHAAYQFKSLNLPCFKGKNNTVILSLSELL